MKSFKRHSSADPASPSPTRSRRHALKLLLGGGAGCLAHGFWIEPDRPQITRSEIVLPSLPPTLDGLRVGVMADFHFKPGADDALLDQAVASMRDEHPDLVLLPGDFMNDDPAVLAPLVAGLKRLTPPHGVFAAMGNHDGWRSDAAFVRRHFEQAGTGFLINQQSILSIRGENLAIAATDHIWRGRPDPAATLRGIAPDIPVLTMVHEPDFFDEMTRHGRPLLQVSGHTHGGQCRVPLIGHAPVKVRYGEKYLSGSFSRGESRLFVTRGIGTTGIRVRFACPPEVAVLTLRCPARS